jgi:hypothetical protein
MKKSILVIIAIAVSTIAFGQKKPKIKGNKVLTEVIKEIPENFNAVEVDDALEITISQGDQNSYHLVTDENLVDVIQFSVKDSILKIYTTNKIVSNKKLEISLNIVDIEHLILKNDARVETTGTIDADKLYVNAYNSSKFDLDIKANDLIVTLQRNAGGKIRATTINATIVMNDRTDLDAYIAAEKTRVTLTKSANLELEGDSDYAAFNLKDAAVLEAKKMKVTSADLYTSNSADVYLYASKNLELYAQGKSTVYVYGNPKMEVKGLTDKSRIIKK